MRAESAAIQSLQGISFSEARLLCKHQPDKFARQEIVTLIRPEAVSRSEAATESKACPERSRRGPCVSYPMLESRPAFSQISDRYSVPFRLIAANERSAPSTRRRH